MKTTMPTKVGKLSQKAKSVGKILLVSAVAYFSTKMLNAQEPINTALLYPGKDRIANIKIDDNSSLKLKGEVTDKGKFNTEKLTFTQEVYYYGTGSEKNKFSFGGKYPVEITSVSNNPYSINFVSTDENGYIRRGTLTDGQSAKGIRNSDPNLQDTEFSNYTINITHSVPNGQKGGTENALAVYSIEFTKDVSASEAEIYSPFEIFKVSGTTVPGAQFTVTGVPEFECTTGKRTGGTWYPSLTFSENSFGKSAIIDYALNDTLNSEYKTIMNVSNGQKLNPLRVVYTMSGEIWFKNMFTDPNYKFSNGIDFQTGKEVYAPDSVYFQARSDTYKVYFNSSTGDRLKFFHDVSRGTFFIKEGFTEVGKQFIGVPFVQNGGSYTIKGGSFTIMEGYINNDGELAIKEVATPDSVHNYYGYNLKVTGKSTFTITPTDAIQMAKLLAYESPYKTEPRWQDIVSPKIVYQTPARGDTLVSKDALIEIAFNEKIADFEFKVQELSGPLSNYPRKVSGIYSYSDTSFSLDATPHLPYDTQIGVSGFVNDTAGNTIEFSYSFTTEQNPVSVTEPTQSEFMQIYPNPTSNQTVLKFNNEMQGAVDIKIYNVLGLQLKRAFNGELPQGENQIPINTNGLPEGTYLIRVQTKEKIYTQKMQVVR